MTSFGGVPSAGEMLASAEMSEDRVYRYRLSRWWGDGPRATFVMLNPSTADEFANDRTVARCMSFATSWGLDGIDVVNLYALRATNPRMLWQVDDPVGPRNDEYILEAGSRGWPLIAAWGNHAKRERVAEVLAMPGLDRLACLRTTKRGAPGHPLYVLSTASLSPWPSRG